MEGIKRKKYLHTAQKRFDPFALVVGVVGVGAVIAASGFIESSGTYWDKRSFIVVFGGTLATIIFQYDFTLLFDTIAALFTTLGGGPERRLIMISRYLDEAILRGQSLSELMPSEMPINEDLLADVVTMVNSGMVFEEIDALVSTRVEEIFFRRSASVALLQRAAVISPSLGLFGTVVGLISLLRSLNDPSRIGPAMSLALITTAYGAALSSLIFTPLAGRLEHFNEVYVEIHRQILSKISVLFHRDERRAKGTSATGVQPAERSA